MKSITLQRLLKESCRLTERELNLTPEEWFRCQFDGSEIVRIEIAGCVRYGVSRKYAVKLIGMAPSPEEAWEKAFLEMMIKRFGGDQ